MLDRCNHGEHVISIDVVSIVTNTQHSSIVVAAVTVDEVSIVANAKHSGTVTEAEH